MLGFRDHLIGQGIARLRAIKANNASFPDTFDQNFLIIRHALNVDSL